MEALSLLTRARREGLRVRIVGDELEVSGPARLASLAEELLRQKKGVLEALVADLAPPLLATLPAGADPTRPPLGWTYLRTGPLEGCWLGPHGALSSGTAGRVGSISRPPTRCYSCRRESPSWWRRISGTGPWACGSCHPPMTGVGPIERWGETS